MMLSDQFSWFIRLHCDLLGCGASVSFAENAICSSGWSHPCLL
jgi:hypothetical protein